MLYYASLIYFVPRKHELFYSSRPFIGPQQFEIELFICIKVDLALHHLKWLICHYSKPNQANSIKHQSFVYTPLKLSNSFIPNKSIYHKSFVCTQFKCQTVLVDPLIGPDQVLPFQVRIDLGVTAMKGYSTFSNALALLEPHHQIV